MYRSMPRNGSEQSHRYAQGQNLFPGYSRSMSAKAPKPMVSRYDGTCKLAECGDRRIVGGVTQIALVNGSWNHETCPETPAVVETQEIATMDDQIADRADALLNQYYAALQATLTETSASHGALGTYGLTEYAALMNEQAKRRLNSPNGGKTEEQIASEADALLEEFASANRARNLETIKKAIYRVSLHGQEGRYTVDHVNIALVPSEKYGTVKIADYDGASIGVIRKDGSIMFWDDVDQKSARTLATLAGLDILLGSADPVKYAEAFAVEAVACMRCGRPLVDEKSRERLLGPECVKLW